MVVAQRFGGFRAPRRAGMVAGLILFAAALRAETAPETAESRLVRAAAGVVAPPPGKDFTKTAPEANYKEGYVLVRFATPGPGMAGSPTTAGVERARLLAAMGGVTVARELRLVPGLCRVKLPPGMTVEEAVARYNKLPGVVYAEPDHEVHAFPASNNVRGKGLLGMPGVTNQSALPTPCSSASTDTTATSSVPPLYRIEVEEP